MRAKKLLAFSFSLDFIVFTSTCAAEIFFEYIKRHIIFFCFVFSEFSNVCIYMRDFVRMVFFHTFAICIFYVFKGRIFVKIKETRRFFCVLIEWCNLNLAYFYY